MKKDPPYMKYENEKRPKLEYQNWVKCAPLNMHFIPTEHLELKLVELQKDLQSAELQKEISSV